MNEIEQNEIECLQLRIKLFKYMSISFDDVKKISKKKLTAVVST